ncbi:MAG: hypothetical protein QXT26_02715 [Thermoproteota archaeon]
MSLGAGETRLVAEGNNSGWVFQGEMSCNDPEVKVRIERFGPDGSVMADEYSAQSLYEMGFLTPSSHSWWCSRYDDTSKVYAIAFSPSAPLFTTDQFSIYIIAPPRPVTVYSFSVSYGEIRDALSFIKSVGDLLGSTVMGGYLALIASQLDALLKMISQIGRIERPILSKIPLEEEIPREIYQGGFYREVRRRTG